MQRIDFELRGEYIALDGLLRDAKARMAYA